MSVLAIGKDNIELRSAIRKVQVNIRWLEARLAGLDRGTEVGRIAGQFYSDKISSQHIILDWLICHSVDGNQVLSHAVNSSQDNLVIDVENASST